jgi:hypothetical protein
MHGLTVQLLTPVKPLVEGSLFDVQLCTYQLVGLSRVNVGMLRAVKIIDRRRLAIIDGMPSI